MEETECLICNCDISKNYKSNVFIAQSCNCIYKVHDDCIKDWCSIKSKCLICHKPIKLYSQSLHKPFIESNNSIPPRLSFFQRVLKCCIS